MTLVLLQGFALARRPASESSSLATPQERTDQDAQSAPNRSACRSGLLPDGWQTVFSETFESGLGPRWTVTDAGAAQGYVWGTSAFTSVTADRSAWCAGGAVEAGDHYTEGMDTRLISEPIHLGAFKNRPWGARVRFLWWLDTASGVRLEALPAGTRMLDVVESSPPSGDWLGWAIFPGDTQLNNQRDPLERWTYVSGATGGWTQSWIPLDDFLPLTDGVTSSVRIAFHFVSDRDGVVGRGAFVDDVTVEVNHGSRVMLPLIQRNAPVPVTPTPIPSPILQNGSFEDGWYDISIGQVPNNWEWYWVDGETLPGSVTKAAAPETRVLPRRQVPPDERDVFFLDGDYCIKVFKSRAPIYAALSQVISGLEKDKRYQFEVPIYVDVFAWEGDKVPPDDPWAAQVRVGVAPPDATWPDEASTAYGEWWNGDNTEDFYLSYHHIPFEFIATQTAMRVYIEVLAKWGMDNNGFFIDDVTLTSLSPVGALEHAGR